MKRSSPDGEVEAPAAKKSREGLSEADLQEKLSQMEVVQKTLFNLDEECAAEQMEVQKKYDQKKKPSFDARNDIIATMPGFWADVLRKHRGLFLAEEDQELLDAVVRIDLEDNIDAKGSFKVTMHFKPNDFLNTNTIWRETRLQEDDDDVITVSAIDWKEGKNLIEKTRKQREQQMAEETPQEQLDYSIFEWFAEEAPGEDEMPSLGEIIRRELWHDPLAQYMAPEPEEEEEEEEEEDDSEQDSDEEGAAEGEGDDDDDDDDGSDEQEVEEVDDDDDDE